MCGIAGIVRRDGRPPEKSVLDALTRALAHRGPDGAGRHVRGGVGLVQTRLAIIDLTTGDQPFYDDAGRALVGNGEIYNYIELRRRMDAARWRTESDCEPPLLLHGARGAAFADDLRGMYALAIHDPLENTVTVARDPFGIKPLYYTEGDFGFAFASEPAALIAAGCVRARLRPQGRNELLQLQFTTGDRTLFEDIRRVLPGETLTVRDGHVIDRRRRPALPAGGPVATGEAEALQTLDRVLEDSVTVHQRSDVDYAMFLSGGIDSSVLLALMARLNEKPVTAYTAGFDTAAVADERARARAVARAARADHVEVAFGAADFWDLLPEIAAAMDDPAADYAILPTYKLARTAARDVKVVLCGEGGDELFGGYGRYRSAPCCWADGSCGPGARSTDSPVI